MTGWHEPRHQPRHRGPDTSPRGPLAERFLPLLAWWVLRREGVHVDPQHEADMLALQEQYDEWLQGRTAE